MRPAVNTAEAPVLLVNAVAEMGGAEWSLLELARALTQRGLNVHAALPAGPLMRGLADAGIACHALPQARLHRPRATAGWVRAWRQGHAARSALRGIIAEVAPRILHANGTTAALLTRRFAPPDDGIVRLWHCRDLMRGRLLTRACAGNQTAIVAISTPVQDRLCALAPRCAGRIACIPNGIDLTRFTTPRRAPCAQHDSARIGMIAHLAPWKRHDRFLECLARLSQRLPDVRGVIVGADLYGEHAALRASLVTRMQQPDLAGRVEFADPERSIPELLRELDVLIHPAEGEPFGRVICEAMAAGCPVVAVDDAGPAEILTHGQTGWLCPTGSAVAQALAEGACHLLQNDTLRHAIIAAAQKAVHQHFDINRTATQIHTLYGAACKPPGIGTR